MPRISLCLFAAAALVLLPVGCSKPGPATSAPGSQPSQPVADQTPAPGDWVIQRIDSDPDTLNPLTGNTTNGQAVVGQITEGLLQMDHFSLKLEPCLAESYEITPDQLTYTFHLRKGVKWQDGEPFTAADVKFTYDRVQDPKVDCPFLRLYFNNIKSCDVVDPYTIRFVASIRYFKTLEMISGLPIMPKHVFDKAPTDFNQHPFGRHPIGTGPYKFVRWDTGSQIILERNDDYWGPVHYPKRLVFQVLEEPYVAAQLLKKGEIDVFEKVSPIQWERDLKGTRSMDHLHEIVYDYPAYYYIGYNLRNPMFSDVRVRHALDLLIPRDDILSQVYLNQYASKTSGYDMPASPSYNHDVLPTPYDPTLALKLLNEAGWKNDHSDGFLYKDNQQFSFTLLYPTGSPEREKTAELTQESYRRAGIDMKLSRVEFAQLVSQLDDWKFDATMLGWSLEVNSDPYQIWHGSQATIKKSSNFIGYKNPEVDKLIDEARPEYDDDKRAAIYRQLHKIIHDDYPVSFLFNLREIVIISDRFQNVKTFAPAPCFDISLWWVPKDQQKYGN